MDATLAIDFVSPERVLPLQLVPYPRDHPLSSSSRDHTSGPLKGDTDPHSRTHDYRDDFPNSSRAETEITYTADRSPRIVNHITTTECR